MYCQEWEGPEGTAIQAEDQRWIGYGQDVHRRVGAAIDLAVVSFGIGFKRIRNLRYSFHSFPCCLHFRIIRISSGAQSRNTCANLTLLGLHGYQSRACLYGTPRNRTVRAGRKGRVAHPL
jgi:hypothetical protein